MWEIVRKFGLEYCDLPTTIWNLAFLHKLISIRISTRYCKHINIIWYIWTVVILTAYIYIWLFSKIWYLLGWCVEKHDIESALFLFPLMITALMGPLKMFFMYLYNDKMKEIVDEYLDIDEQITPDTRFSKNIALVMKQVKKRALVYWMIIVGNAILYIGRPLMTPKRNFMNGLFTLYGLDPILESPNYEIAYTLMALSLFAICYSAATVTGLHIVLVGYTEAQTLALAADVKNLWNDAEIHYQETRAFAITDGNNNNKVEEDEINTQNYAYKNEIMNKFIKLRLNHIAAVHATNMHLIKKIEVLFRGAVVVEFLFLGIGVICYLLAGLENTYSAVPYSLVHVSMDCLTGQNIIDASIVFENAMYDSKWENFDVSNRKAVLLILANSQKNMILSAGGVATLDFNSLMTVFRMIYSAYTTLLSTVK